MFVQKLDISLDEILALGNLMILPKKIIIFWKLEIRFSNIVEVLLNWDISYFFIYYIGPHTF